MESVSSNKTKDNKTNTDQPTNTSVASEHMDSVRYGQLLNESPTTYDLFKKGHDINPDAPALSFFLQGTAYKESETFSYAEMLTELHQVGNFMDALELEDDAVVAMLLPNLPECYSVIIGVQTRHIIMPINPLLEPEVISELLATAKARVLVTLAPFPNTEIWSKAKYIAQHVQSLAHVVSINMADHVLGKKSLPAKVLQKRQDIIENDVTALLFGSKAGLPNHINWHNWKTAIAKQPGDRLTFENNKSKRRNSLDYSSFFCTGGTTGRPKIAKRIHKNEVSNVLQVRAALGDDFVGNGKNLLCGLPLFHTNAVMVTGMLPFSLGSHVVLATPQGYRGEGVVANFWDIIEQYRINFFSGVPTLFSSLLNIPIKNQDVSSLQYCLSGAAPMPIEVFNQFEAQTGMTILEAYGLTEANCGSSVNPREGERKIGSIGQSFPHQEMIVAILEEDGLFRHAKVGEVGNVIIRGDNVFAGYYIDSQNKDIWLYDTVEDKQKADNNQLDPAKRWVNSGDLGYQDSDGFFFLTGRKKELIIRGGHNIDPKLIEEPVYKFGDIEICAAIGKPDVYAGEIPILYVQPKTGASIDKQALEAYCQDHIGERAAIPKEVHIIDEIPLTPVGKVFKPALKRLANVEAVATLLNEHNVAADVTTQEDATYGFITCVKVADPNQLETAKHLAGQFAIALDIR